MSLLIRRPESDGYVSLDEARRNMSNRHSQGACPDQGPLQSSHQVVEHEHSA